MRKIIIIVLLFSSIFTSAQYKIPQGIGGKETMLTVGGGLTVVGGIIYVNFTDTTAANLNLYVRFYPNMQITTGDSIWKRNLQATKWNLLNEKVSDLTFE